MNSLNICFSNKQYVFIFHFICQLYLFDIECFSVHHTYCLLTNINILKDDYSIQCFIITAWISVIYHDCLDKYFIINVLNHDYVHQLFINQQHCEMNIFNHNYWYHLTIAVDGILVMLSCKQYKLRKLHLTLFCLRGSLHVFVSGIASANFKDWLMKFVHLCSSNTM